MIFTKNKRVLWVLQRVLLRNKTVFDEKIDSGLHFNIFFTEKETLQQSLGFYGTFKDSYWGSF